jgi:hypothetical protein
MARLGKAMSGLARRGKKTKTFNFWGGKMNQIKMMFVGETGFLMHNNRLANPLDPYTMAMGSKSGKRKKTIEDIKELARIEWEGGLYLYDGEIKIPMRVVNKTMERGATKQKNGTLWKTGCMVMDDYCKFDYPGAKIKCNGSKDIPNPDLDKYYENHNHQTIVRVGQASLLRTRPIFNDWTLETTIVFEPNVINRETVIQCAQDAGRLAGIGDWRIEKGGGFGRFSVEVIE